MTTRKFIVPESFTFSGYSLETIISFNEMRALYRAPRCGLDITCHAFDYVRIFTIQGPIKYWPAMKNQLRLKRIRSALSHAIAYHRRRCASPTHACYRNRSDLILLARLMFIYRLLSVALSPLKLHGRAAADTSQ